MSNQTLFELPTPPWDKIIFDTAADPTSSKTKQSGFSKQEVDALVKEAHELKAPPWILYGYYNSLGTITVLSSYTKYEATERLIDEGLLKEDEIPIIVVKSVDEDSADSFRTLLQSKNASTNWLLENPLSRLAIIRRLHDLDYNLVEIKGMIGGGRPLSSADDKKVERDYSLAKSRVYYCVTGATEDNPYEICTDKMSFGPTNGLKIVQILGSENETLIDEFCDTLDEKINDPNRMEDDEDETLPLMKKSWYPQLNPVKIALKVAEKNVADGGDIDDFADYLLEKELKVNRFKIIKSKTDPHKVIGSSYSFKIFDGSYENISFMVDSAYKQEVVSKSQLSYLRNINPIIPGGPIRSKSMGDNKQFDNWMNNFEFESPKYVKYIYKERFLYYCCPILFLKSLGLKCDNFGFNKYSYANNNLASKPEILACYREWLRKLPHTAPHIYYGMATFEHRDGEQWPFSVTTVHILLKRVMEERFEGTVDGDVMPFAVFLFRTFGEVFVRIFLLGKNESELNESLDDLFSLDYYAK